MRSILSLCLLLAACPSTSEEAPAPEIPDLSGEYSLVFSQANTQCFPPDYLFEDIFAFLDNVDSGTPVSTATFAQDGTQLAVTLHSSDCILTGGVGEAGAFNVLGQCDDDTMTRELDVQGDASRSGLSGWSIAATGTLDVDSNDGAGGGPDGTVDCVVDDVTVTGTGAPAN